MLFRVSDFSFTSENGAMLRFRGHGKQTYSYNLTLFRVLFARGGFPARGAGDGVPAWGLGVNPPTYKAPARDSEESRANLADTASERTSYSHNVIP